MANILTCSNTDTTVCSENTYAHSNATTVRYITDDNVIDYDTSYRPITDYIGYVDYTAGASTSYSGNFDWGLQYAIPSLSRSDRLREILKKRVFPQIIRGKKRSFLPLSTDLRETRARQTLKRIIGEKSFKRFIRDGFITVVSKSGLTYKIYPGHGMTDIYDHGKQIDCLCIILKGQFPATDSLIMRYLLILNDECEFKKRSISHRVYSGSPIKMKVEDKSLVEVWKGLKVA